MRGDTERKQVSSAIHVVKGAEAVEAGTFSIRLAHLGLPPDRSRTRDVVRPGATPPHWASFGGYNHSTLSGDLPAGKMYVYEQDGHVVADGLFFNSQVGQEMRRTMQGLGGLAQFSVEYRVTKEGDPTQAEKAAGAGRIVVGWDVFGGSLVQEGAMPFTGLTDIKCDRCRGEASPGPAEIAQLARETERTLAKARDLLDPWTPEREAAFRRTLARFNAVEGSTLGVRVDPAKHRSAIELVAWGARRWGVRAPGVKFVDAGDMPNDQWSGFSLGGDPGTVHLRSDLSGAALAEICFHEVSHVGRHAHGLPQDEREVKLDAACLLQAYLRGEP